MKIEVKLNKKSIQNTIKLLNQQKKILNEKAIPEFMENAAKWIQDEANKKLASSDVGSDVKKWISNAWTTEWVGKNHLKLINYSWKACYVEFGVGIIGETTQHPNSDKTNWEYNLETGKKDVEGGWIFEVKDSNKLDIPQDAILDETYLDDNLIVYTKGSQGVWFLFNAMEDFKLRRAQSLWEEIKKKYWG